MALQSGSVILLWHFKSLVAQQFPEYIPTIKGFDDLSGVILLCVYILMRFIRRLDFTIWLQSRIKLVLSVFVISGTAVFLGFRQHNSIFAFAFAYSLGPLKTFVSLECAYSSGKSLPM